MSIGQNAHSLSPIKTIDKIIINADVINKVTKPKIIHAEKAPVEAVEEKKQPAKKTTEGKTKKTETLTATSA